MSLFRFKQFSLEHERSTMKIGTDAVLLAALTDVGKAKSVLDVGCGCGVIGFCLAQQLSQKSTDVLLYGIDPDENSIREARTNAQRFPLLPAQAFHFVQDSIQNFAHRQDAPKFDLVVSNPPFFQNDLKPSDASRLKSKHRDQQLPFQDLVDCVDILLKPDGRFVIILPTVESAEFEQLASVKWHCSQRIFLQPTARKPVHRVIQTYVLSDVMKVDERVLVIRNEQNEYTEDFASAVKPYLL